MKTKINKYQSKLCCILYVMCLMISHQVTVFAQFDSDLNFRHFDNTNGLPNNFINTIEMDSLGFLWIGTNDGLCRFDSPQKVKTFKLGDIGLESTNIKTLEASNDSILWIGTSLGGLTKYNILSGAFKTYNPTGSSKNQLSNNEILSIHTMESGEVWVGTEEGLNVIYPEKDSIYQFPIIKDSDSHIQATAILDIMQDDKGWIWLGTWGGSYYLYLPSGDGDHSNGKFRKIILGENDGTSSIWKVYQDSRGRYWMPSHINGLYSMDLPATATNDQSNQDWKPIIHQFQSDLAKKIDISSDYIFDVEEDSDGNIWIGTVHGLNIITTEEINNYEWSSTNPTTDLKFFKQFHYPNKTNNLSNNLIKELYSDKQGLMWIGSTSGINQYSKYANQFNVYNITTDDTDLVNSIYAKDATTVLLGSNLRGLLTYDLTKKELVQNESFIGEIFGNQITSFYKEMNGDKLYVGAITGLGYIDMKTKKKKLYSLSKNSTDTNSNIYITTIFKDSKERLWAGTETGLVYIDETTGELKWFHHEFEDKSSVSDNSITQVFEDSRNNIWVTTFNGISRLIETTDEFTFENFKSDDFGIGEMPSSKVSSIAEYDGKIYFGSRSGIFSYDHSSSSFEALDNQRVKHNISGILVNQEGIMWASTSDGVLRVDLNTTESKLYGKLEGIGGISFRVNATSKDDLGKFYLGGHRGFIQIDEANIKRNTNVPDVYITDIQSINSNSKNSFTGINNGMICVPPDNYLVSINYAALNYNQIENNQYAYKLEGFEDEEWNYTTNQEVVYTNLERGEYIFKVKASNNEGVWNNEGKSIRVIVHAAFTETIWFKILLAIFAIAFLRLVNLLYTKNIRKRNELLKEYNDRLNTQVKKTEAANASLEKREKDMRVLLERLDQSNKELLRSNKDLEQFAYVASHDMKEPLRTVGTFTTLLKRKYGPTLDKNGKEYMNFISEGVERMSALINSLLSYSQVGKKDVEFKKSDLNVLVQTKIKDLSKIIADRNVTIDCEDLPSVYCATNQIGMVFYNLILNGIKFNKSLNPKIHILSSETETHYIFYVKDNGIGIPAEYQNQIFEIFKRLHSKEEYEGTGIGLALCNKIIHRHNGTIKVNSNDDQGTTFYFTISKDIKPTTQLAKEKTNSELGQAVEEILRA